VTAAREKSAPDIETLPFSTGSDDDVIKLLKQHKIGLSVPEARKIVTLLGRNPTLAEAIIWGIQGSEHCSYKSSKRFLRTLPTEGKHVILGPGEDSGIVAITDEPKGKRWGLVIAHESHNHPSQIVPFEGAATGVGGVVRDVVCMGARVVGCMDMLRLGDLQTEESRTIAREVVRGIAGYGNPLGIPNLGGDTVFDAAYNSNCLVNAVAMGIAREDEVIRSHVPDEAGKAGYDIILVGKPTDRSGFGGAAFASASMEEEKREQNSGAVQEPNPFLERHLLASCYALFDWLAAEGHLGRVSCKDLGAGGVVCATVEQVAEKGLGADVDLGKVHTAIDDLPAEVIGCAETQERFCFMCHPDLTEHILRHFNEVWDLPSVAEKARASVIGKVNDTPIYRAHYRGQVVCDAKAVDITSGLQEERPLKPMIQTRAEPDIRCEGNHVFVSRHLVTRTSAEKDEVTKDEVQAFSFEEIFKAMLVHRNGSSRAPVFRQYDKDIIGNTVVEAGEADAAVIAPLQDLQSYVHEGAHPGWELSEDNKFRGIAVAGGGKGRYGRIDPYWQGANAAAEAMRNVAATGATPRALTDCLNYGNPEVPEQLWQLSEGVRGLAEAARGIQVDGEAVPIISGNVSLYNGRPDGSAIDPTAIVACVGVMPDARRAIGMHLSESGLQLYLIGDRRDECGGSLYYEVLEELSGAPRDAMLGQNVPKPDFKTVASDISLLLEASNQDLVSACHDISDGGLLFALFEMLVPLRKRQSSCGLDMQLEELPPLSPDRLLFSETGGFVVAVTPEKVSVFEALAKKQKVSLLKIGHTTDDANVALKHGNISLLESPLSPLLKAWAEALALA